MPRVLYLVNAFFLVAKITYAIHLSKNHRATQFMYMLLTLLSIKRQTNVITMAISLHCLKVPYQNNSPLATISIMLAHTPNIYFIKAAAFSVNFNFTQPKVETTQHRWGMVVLNITNKRLKPVKRKVCIIPTKTRTENNYDLKLRLLPSYFVTIQKIAFG